MRAAAPTAPSGAAEEPVRVLVAEHSAAWENAWRAILDQRPGLEVVGVVRDGATLLEKLREARADILLLDLRLPQLDQLQVISRIMADQPLPIACAADGSDHEREFAALGRGALELISKPEALPVTEVYGRYLERELRRLARVPVVRHVAPRSGSQTRVQPFRGRIEVVGVVSSTGGPAALKTLLRTLRADHPPILLVQHMADRFMANFTRWLSTSLGRPVELATHGEMLRPGAIRLAPDDHHLEVAPGPRTLLVRPQAHATTRHVPSGDRLLSSLAKLGDHRCLGIVLTGMGDDGCAGLEELRRAGGRTYAQDQATSAVYGMPRVAAESGAAQVILPLADLATMLGGLGTGRSSR